MPYIAAQDRKRVDDVVEMMPKLQTEGELNYTVTRLVDKFLREHGFNYKNLNAVVGVLECAKLEAYRRMAAPYEDGKAQLNGDAYSEQHTRTAPILIPHKG